MRWTLFLMLLWAGVASAAPLKLAWDPVTAWSDGTPFSATDTLNLRYRVYRRVPPATTWTLMYTTRNTTYSQQIVQWGHTRWRVTAVMVDQNNESPPSDEIGAFIDLRAEQEP
jgi:hypothetical protein